VLHYLLWFCVEVVVLCREAGAVLSVFTDI
jgi:hypothetical protein